jgi:hypothetical protein
MSWNKLKSVTPSSRLVINKKYLLAAGLGLIGLVVVWIVVASWLTWLTARSLNSLSFDQANTRSGQALLLVRPLALISGGQPDLVTWQTGLELIDTSSGCRQQTQTYLETNLAAGPQADRRQAAEQLRSCLSKIDSQLAALNSAAGQSWLIQHQPIWRKLETKLPLAQQALAAAQTLLTDQHTIIILLQNSQEIRATGGFMGSFAQLDLDQGAISSLEIYDIYQPDGQFDGYLEAPPGVELYLSGGKGLRLPDANWHPDFPSSAQQILRFMALAGRENIDTVLAINLSVAEDLLRVTGNIELPDYQITVTPDNIAQVARADREQFFAGSYQKVNFLAALMTKLKLQLTQLSPEKQQALLQLLILQAQTKEIAGYSNLDPVQQLLASANLTGQLMLPLDTLPLYLVESNVGVNKANQQISRQVAVEYSPYRVTMSLKLNNQNPPDSQLNYINYQRLLTTPETAVHQIYVGQTELTSWDENIVTNRQGDRFKQIGFLVEVPLGQTRTITIDLIPGPNQPAFVGNIALFKQPGLPPIPYQIEADGQQHSLLLETDAIIDWQ